MSVSLLSVTTQAMTPSIPRNYSQLPGDGDCCPDKSACKSDQTGPYAVSTGGDYPNMSKAACDSIPGCVAFGQMYSFVTRCATVSSSLPWLGVRVRMCACVCVSVRVCACVLWCAHQYVQGRRSSSHAGTTSLARPSASKARRVLSHLSTQCPLPLSHKPRRSHDASARRYHCENLPAAVDNYNSVIAVSGKAPWACYTTVK